MQHARLKFAVQVFRCVSLWENDSIQIAEIHNQSRLCAVMVIVSISTA